MRLVAVCLIKILSFETTHVSHRTPVINCVWDLAFRVYKHYSHAAICNTQNGQIYPVSLVIKSFEQIYYLNRSMRSDEKNDIQMKY